jgi:hypothetical protein
MSLFRWWAGIMSLGSGIAVDPMQQKINEQTEFIKNARIALRKSADAIQELKREITVIQNDISALNFRAKGSDDATARDLLGRIIERENLLLIKQTELEEALAEHKKVEAMTDDWQKSLKDLDRFATLRGLQVNLAAARQAASDFQSEVSTCKSELNVKAATAQGVADLSEQTEDDYLKTLKEQEIEKRLAALKENQ